MGPDRPQVLSLRNLPAEGLFGLSPPRDLSSFVATGRRAWTTMKSGPTAPWRDTTALAPPFIAPSRYGGGVKPAEGPSPQSTIPEMGCARIPLLIPIPWDTSLSSALAAAESGLLPRGGVDHQAHRPCGHPGGQPPPAPEGICGGPGRRGGSSPLRTSGSLLHQGGTPHSGVTPSFCKPPPVLTPAGTVLARAWTSAFCIRMAGNMINGSGQRV